MSRGHPTREEAEGRGENRHHSTKKEAVGEGPRLNHSHPRVKDFSPEEQARRGRQLLPLAEVVTAKREGTT